MSYYIIRRFLYAIPVIIGVNVITFVLFFYINSPEQMAQTHLGEKRVTLEQIERWKRQRNYHLPYFYNNGWQQEAVREVSESGWINFSYLTSGKCALVVEVKKGKAQVDLQIASFQSPSLLLPSPWKSVENKKSELQDSVPDGYIIEGSISIEVSEDKKKRLEFEVTNPDGAKLSLHTNPNESGIILRLHYLQELNLFERFTQTIFFQKSIKFLWFDFGIADDGRPIGQEILKRVPPSLSITIPMFILGLLVEITFAMILAFFRATYLDFWGVILCVIMMSISIMFYVIGGQWFFSKVLKLVPISGFDTGVHSIKFVILPVVIGILGGIGINTRFYRTLFLEEINKDYVRTARSKGLPEYLVLYKHALKNAMIPILTGVVTSLPFLFTGSLILESFFAIPGMGAFMLEAIQRQDFAIVQAMVFLGAVLYIMGLIMTDIAYTLVDPRVRFE